jgi:hypothetical protein
MSDSNICECFICDKYLDPPCVPVEEHPFFPVPVCTPCSLNCKGELEQEEGEECAICGDGGELLLCDHCPRAMCCNCLGKVGVYQEALACDKWACLHCDPSPFSIKVEKMLETFMELNFKHPTLDNSIECECSLSSSSSSSSESVPKFSEDCPRCSAVVSSYVDHLIQVEDEIAKVKEDSVNDEKLQDILEEYGLNILASQFHELCDCSGGGGGEQGEDDDGFDDQVLKVHGLNREKFQEARKEYDTLLELFEDRLSLLSVYQVNEFAPAVVIHLYCHKSCCYLLPVFLIILLLLLLF